MTATLADTKYKATTSVLVKPIALGATFDFFGEDYLYLKDKGSGDYLILRKYLLPKLSKSTKNYHGSDLEKALEKYYVSLPAKSKDVVQPIDFTITSGGTMASEDDRFIMADAPEDFATVTSSGEKKAFALSVAELCDVSGEGTAFPTVRLRGAVMEGSPITRDTYERWWTRTPETIKNSVWNVNNHVNAGRFFSGEMDKEYGVRPALIIHQ